MEQYSNNQPALQQFIFKAALIFAGALILDNLKGEPEDTVNYILFIKAKKCIMGYRMRIVFKSASTNMSVQASSSFTTVNMIIQKQG